MVDVVKGRIEHKEPGGEGTGEGGDDANMCGALALRFSCDD